MINYPKKKLFGKTWVGWLNFLLIQWFFIRIQGEVNTDYTQTKWSILHWVVPLSGWWSDYVFLNDD